MVLDKPSGLIVNRSQTAKTETLQDWLDDYLGIPNGGISDEVYLQRSGMVHRLDRDTSGVLVVAKDVETLQDLMAQFKERQVSKKYLALVHGELKDQKIDIQAPIARNPRNRLKNAVVADGKFARTVVERISVKDGFSLVFAKPQTGRTHQIRVHLSATNHPIVGDPLYSPKALYKKTSPKFGRLMLHAQALEFKHPKYGEKVHFEAKVPSEFALFLS